MSLIDNQVVFPTNYEGLYMRAHGTPSSNRYYEAKAALNRARTVEAQALEARDALARAPVMISRYDTYPPGTTASVIQAVEAKAALDRAQAVEAQVLEAQSVVTQAIAELAQAEAA